MKDKTMTLGPCPWCGTKGMLEANFGKEWWVQCENDHSDGVIYSSPQEAETAWNTRHLSQTAERGDEKVVVIRDGQATTEGLVLAAAIYMGAVKDIFALRSDGPPYNERKVTKDADALRAFDHLDAATKALRSAISHFAPTAERGEADEVAVEILARQLYAKWNGNQGIHCNRFPGWNELSEKERDEWRAKARVTHPPAHPTKLEDAVREVIALLRATSNTPASDRRYAADKLTAALQEIAP